MDWFLYDNGPHHERVKQYPVVEQSEPNAKVGVIIPHARLMYVKLVFKSIAIIIFDLFRQNYYEQEEANLHPSNHSNEGSI